MPNSNASAQTAADNAASPPNPVTLATDLAGHTITIVALLTKERDELAKHGFDVRDVEVAARVNADELARSNARLRDERDKWRTLAEGQQAQLAKIHAAVRS